MPTPSRWSDTEFTKKILQGTATGSAAFTDEELERLSKWFRDKWKHGPCPVCTTDNWLINAKISQIFNEQTLQDGSSFPVVLIVCSNCGYTIPINSRIAQVRIEDAPDEEATQAEGI